MSCLSYDIINKQLSESVESQFKFFKYNKHDRIKGFNYNYHRTTFGQRSMSHQLPEVWNKIPNNIKILDKYKFKKKIKYLLSSDI